VVERTRMVERDWVDDRQEAGRQKAARRRLPPSSRVPASLFGHGEPSWLDRDGAKTSA
jgi:hypothetical protein